MKCYKLLFLVLSIPILIYQTNLYSQDTNIVKYFPLNIGNVWVYSGSYSSVSCHTSYYQRIFIDSSKFFNNKRFFKFNYVFRITSGNGSCGYTQFYDGYYRIDSLSGNIYRYRIDTNCSYSPFESLIDSLYSKLRDSAKTCSGSQYYLKVAFDTNSQNIFSLDRPSKTFQGGNFFEYAFFTRYAKDLGVSEMWQGGISISSHSYLKGCVINGINYGDTNYYYVGLSQIGIELPGKFDLYQNYPNPFNPSTQIRFDIPKSNNVRIVIYDALGKEIEQLLNDNLAAGSYSIDWNAKAYPSGVYFYKLMAGDFVQTRKMVLVK